MRDNLVNGFQNFRVENKFGFLNDAGAKREQGADMLGVVEPSGLIAKFTDCCLCFPNFCIRYPVQLLKVFVDKLLQIFK